MVTFLALARASEDARLRGAPLHVYLWLSCHHLDVEAWRPVKLAGLAAVLKIKRHTASRALRVLVEGGYVVRRGQAATGYEYRLVHQVANTRVA